MQIGDVSVPLQLYKDGEKKQYWETLKPKGRVHITVTVASELKKNDIELKRRATLTQV